MDGYVTEKVIQQIQHVLSHPEERQRMVERNYEIAQQFFSYEVLAYKLMTIMVHLKVLQATPLLRN